MRLHITITTVDLDNPQRRVSEGFSDVPPIKGWLETVVDKQRLQLLHDRRAGPKDRRSRRWEHEQPDRMSDDRRNWFTRRHRLDGSQTAFAGRRRILSARRKHDEVYA